MHFAAALNRRRGSETVQSTDVHSAAATDRRARQPMAAQLFDYLPYGGGKDPPHYPYAWGYDGNNLRPEYWWQPRHPWDPPTRGYWCACRARATAGWDGAEVCAHAMQVPQ